MKKAIMCITALVLLIGVGIAISHPSVRIEELKDEWAENPNQRNTNRIVATCLDLNTEYTLCKAELEAEKSKPKISSGSGCDCNCPSYPIGDANQDGKVDVLDMITVRNLLK